MDEKTSVQSLDSQSIPMAADSGIHGSSMQDSQTLATDSLSQYSSSDSCTVSQPPPTILSSDLCELSSKFEGESLIKVDSMLTEPCEYLEEVSVFGVGADGDEGSHSGLIDGSVGLEGSTTLLKVESDPSTKPLVGNAPGDKEDDVSQPLKSIDLQSTCTEESKYPRMNLLDSTAPLLMSEEGVIFQCLSITDREVYFVSLEDEALLMNEPLTEDHLSIACEPSSEMGMGNSREASVEPVGAIADNKLDGGSQFPHLEAAEVGTCVQDIPSSSLIIPSYEDCERNYDSQEQKSTTKMVSCEIPGPSTDHNIKSQLLSISTTDSSTVLATKKKRKCSPALKDEERTKKELKVTHATIYAPAPRRMRKGPTDGEEISSELHKCFMCSDSFPTNGTLKHHLVTKHQQSNFELFTCFLCDQECWSSSQQDWHLRIQHGIKNKDLACPVCGTQFSIPTECRAHIRKHPVNLNCPSCPRKFAAEHQLTKHVKQHLEEIQPYSCLQCSIRFTHPKVLKVHMWRHNTQNCPEGSCDHEAEDESWLIHHLQDHHKYTTQSVRSMIATRNSADYKMDSLLLRYNQVQEDKSKSRLSSNLSLETSVSNAQLAGEPTLPLLIKVENTDECTSESIKDAPDCSRPDIEVSSVLGDMIDTIVSIQEEEKKSVKRKEEILRKVFDGGTSLHRCGLCNSYHSSLEELAIHKAEHNQVLECIKCQKSFLSVKQLKRHMTVHNPCKEDDQKLMNKDKGLNEHRCLVCGKTFGSESALSRHSSIHGRSEGRHQCKMCSRRVRTRAHLTEHMSRVHKVHSESKKIHCPMCDRRFVSNFHLNLHLITHGETKPLYSCKVCNRSYLRPRSLRRHMVTHGQSFVCDTCNESFPSARRLAIHARGHDPSYKSKIQCPRCPVTFPYKSQMEVHLRTHTGEKPYVCETCGKCFKRLQHCKTHHKVMHGKEKYPCKECGKPFSDKANLLRHRLKVHYHLNRWVCGVCAQSYAYSEDLRRHLKKKHDFKFQRLDYAYKKSMTDVYVIPELGTREISASIRAAIECICEIEKNKVKEILSGTVPDLTRQVPKPGGSDVCKNSDPDDPVPLQETVDVSRPLFIPSASVALSAVVGNTHLQTGGQGNSSFQTVVSSEIQGLVPLQVAGVKCVECGIDIASPQQCGACGVMVCSQAHMDVHIASVHQVLFQCSVCGLHYSSQNDCVAHVTTSHSSHLLAVQGGATTYLSTGQTRTIQGNSAAVPPQLCLPLAHSQPNPQCLLQVGGCPPQLPVAVAPAAANITSQQMATTNCVLQYPNIVSGIPSSIPVLPQATALEPISDIGKKTVFAMTNIFPSQHQPSLAAQPSIGHVVKKQEPLQETSLCTINLPPTNTENILVPSDNNSVVALAAKPNSSMLPTILRHTNSNSDVSSIIVGNSDLGEQQDNTSVLLVDSVPVPNTVDEVPDVLPQHKLNPLNFGPQTSTSVASVLLTLAETPQDDQSSVLVPSSALQITDNQVDQDLPSIVEDVSLGHSKKEVIGAENSGFLQSIVELPSQDKEEQIQESSLSLTENMQIMDTSRDCRPLQEISVEIVQPHILKPESKSTKSTPKKSSSRAKRKRPDTSRNEVHECGTCGKSFPSSSRLKKHQATHGVPRFKCQVCSKAFTKKYNLKIHMLTHTQERPHECSLCLKSFRYLRDLAEHKRTHEGTRPHVCDVCQKAFIRQRDLTRHQREQHDSKRYQCKVCGLPFKRRLYLKTVHMRIHHPMLLEASDEGKTKETTPTKAEIKQSHICKICGRNFARARYLTSHLRVHSKRADYVRCPICPRMFTSEQTLKVHKEAFHDHEPTMGVDTVEIAQQGDSITSNFDKPHTEHLIISETQDMTDSPPSLITSSQTHTSQLHPVSSKQELLLPPMNLPTSVQPTYASAIGRSEEVMVPGAAQGSRMGHFNVTIDDCEAINYLAPSFPS